MGQTQLEDKADGDIIAESCQRCEGRSHILMTQSYSFSQCAKRVKGSEKNQLNPGRYP